MKKTDQDHSRYVAVTQEAEAWGTTVRAGGLIVNERGAPYPPAGHPADHAFAWEQGRVLGGWQVVVITAGEGEFDAEAPGGTGQRVAAGDVLWITPGRWHRYRPARRTGWTEQWLELGGRTVAGLTSAGVLAEDCRVLRPARREAAAAAVAKAVRLLREGAGHAELAAAALQVLGVLAERGPEAGGRLERAVRAAERLLAERLADAPPMPEVARALGVSYAGFRREFRRRTGVAPQQYLLRLRLDRAQRLIGASPFTLEAVAEQTGFASAFHLSAAFRRRFGRSPRDWRTGKSATGEGRA